MFGRLLLGDHKAVFEVHMTTAQEIFEREGFLIASSSKALKIGGVLENRCETAIVPVGVHCVIVEEVSRAFAEQFCDRNWQQLRPGDHFYYKVVAE
jgi:hypothetical protein